MDIPSKLRRAIYERDEGLCRLCASRGQHIHHIVSAGMGRKRLHTEWNLVTLCQRCHREVHEGKNSEKMQRLLENWSRKRYGGMVDGYKKGFRNS